MENSNLNEDKKTLSLNSMVCLKEGHDESPYIYFKFSENKEQIIQCIQCFLEDPENDKKINIEQLFKKPIWQIKNFPPLKDKNQEKEVKKCLENFTQQKIKEYQNDVKLQIEHFYEKAKENMLKSLAQQKKDSIQQFENLFVFSNLEELYNLEPLKQYLKQLEKKEIIFEQFYEYQLKMKRAFEDENKPNIVLEQNQLKQEINKQLNYLKQQLNEKVDVFSKNIKIDNNVLARLQNIQQHQQIINKTPCSTQQQQKIQQKLYQQGQFYINSKNSQNFSNPKIKFYKSNFNQDYNVQKDIFIKNNNKVIQFDNKVINQYKQVYSEPLDKDKTYHVKIKLNLQQQNKQTVTFHLIDSNDKDNDWESQNYIYISNINGDYGSDNVESKIKIGQNFSSFLEDDVTIFNIVFNYSQKIFEVYDDYKKGKIKTVIDQNLILGDLLLGLDIFQNHNNKATYTILDIKFEKKNIAFKIKLIMQSVAVLDNQNSQNSKNALICQNEDHDQSPLTFFKFSENKRQVLQCVLCSLEDPENDKKIIIEQLFKKPIWQIKNFPPLKDKSQDKEVKNGLENFTQKKIKEYQNDVKLQIEHFYEKAKENMLKSLAQQKKDSIQQFENLFVFSNLEELYNLEPLKQYLKQLEKKEIIFEQFYEYQLKIKRAFEDENNPNIVLEQGLLRQEINKQLVNLQQQLKEKVEIFSTNIKINHDILNKLNNNNQQQENITRKLQYTQQQQQIFQQQEQEKQQIYIKNLQNYTNPQIKFYKSNYNQIHNVQEDISIENNNKVIKFDNQVIKRYKQVYSEPLYKDKTYHFKMKLNLQQQNKQQVTFTLLDSNDKDIYWDGQNYIYITNSKGNYGSGHVISKIIEGQKFSSFMEDDVTIFNIVFNYSQKLFEVYDDDKKGHVKAVINQELIKHELLFGLDIKQQHNNKVTYTILDIKCY
ncbi:hypothetical protein PPERSA_07379 [Pseudocohnilembus persalinus]|uniref:Uncharacterized protein n=1 Tax=Pseudocohnilembus persalinus TaxID=266149 RepID=A0A0V0Q9M5_PSEPJ|nr:hypothetical protein PPERSA_07379 [Pseudocohnilembus persalinus]|eukprot:KRW98881.1 hypothetical protein PPERSA_07379 [Pseudocohnilembus persalinus]